MVRRNQHRLGLVLVSAAVAAISACSFVDSDSQAVSLAQPSTVPSSAQSSPTTSLRPSTSSTAPTSTTLPLLDQSVWADPAGSGRPWSDAGAIDGLLTFRGNPSRTYHGQGPVPEDPTIVWTHEIGCSNSPVGGENKTWCGSGWTGQPAVFPSPSDPTRWWLAFGAYDRNVTFLDPQSGEPTYPPYATADIIKGTVTVDPDGYPLLYTGSRDNFLHIVALDRPEPVALWRLSAEAVQPTRWNNDWDGSALVFDDYLIEGGENSRFFIVKLNRGYTDGLVTVDPEIVWSTESWDAQLQSESPSPQYSIENSVVVVGNTVFWANSAGLIQGWDLSEVPGGGAPRQTFRFWVGDDTDATLVADAQGQLYAGVEYELGTARSEELGQVLRLNPAAPADPLVWGVAARSGRPSGVWATPALWEDLVIVATDDGRVLGLDQTNGEQRWVLELPGPLWSVAGNRR